MVTGYVLVDLSWLQHISGMSMQDSNSRIPQYSVFAGDYLCILNSTIKTSLQTGRVLHLASSMLTKNTDALVIIIARMDKPGLDSLA